MFPRSRIRRPLAWSAGLVGAGVLTLSLAGCGSDGASATSSTTSPSMTASAPMTANVTPMMSGSASPMAGHSMMATSSSSMTEPAMAPSSGAPMASPSASAMR